MNPTIRGLTLPVTVAAASLLQGCAAPLIQAAITAAASDPNGTVGLAKDLGGKAKAALAPSDAASTPAAAAPVAAKAGITRSATACPAPATSTQGQAAASQGQSPAARAAAAKLGGNKVAQATQLIGVAKDATALAKDAAGAIDGSCVTITVGRGVASKDGSVTLANNTPKTNMSFNISAPNCTATNAAGNAVGKAWSSVKGAFSSEAKAETPANDACASDKATVQAELAAAGTKAATAYRGQYKVPATTRVDYVISSNTVDLSAVLTNAATGAVTQQVQQVVPANAGAALVRELKK